MAYSALSFAISTDTQGVVLEEYLHEEIVAAGPYSVNFVGVLAINEDDIVHICCDGDPSMGDTSTITTVVAAHGDVLLKAKKAKITEIDARTSELISEGFTYSSKTFSLSLYAQGWMTAVHQARNNIAFTYPVAWNTIDDLDVYSIPNAADMEDFYFASVSAIRGHLDSGTALKNSVRAATTTAEVAAVTDNR